MPGEIGHPVGELLDHGIRHGLPTQLGLTHLVGRLGGVAPPPLDEVSWVFVCENAALPQWAVAQDLRVPIVLGSGQPSLATRRLLARTAAAGWRIAVGADFEVGGLHAARLLLDELGNAAVPWRLTAADHEAGRMSGEANESVPASLALEESLVDKIQRATGRVTEEGRWAALTADLHAGRPGGPMPSVIE